MIMIPVARWMQESLSAGWFSPDEIRETAYRHRSPLVMRCVEDHLAGKRYPLEILTHYD